MRSRSSSSFLITGIAASSLVLAGCATASTPTGDAGDNALIQIVASTDVYGDIASRVGGEFAEVTSIISGSAQDPHSYEATAQDQLTLSKADLVIENGGGYDPFIDSMLDASGDKNVVVVNASEASGLIEGGEGGPDDHADETEEEHAEEEGDAHADETEEEHAAHIEGFNEHVWYSFHGVEKIAAEIAHELGEIDEANAAAYEENYEAFAAEIAELEERAESMRSLVAGQGAAVTEPVPNYLLEEIGFENMTPSDFSEAVEEGTDVSPAVLQETLSLFDDGSVILLAYNEQTSGPITEQVRTAAQDAGVAVVSLTETLPDGEDYISWMSGNLDAIEDALA
ncbi:zinc/manganese transport system substrate-binding protein [Rhodoglobus vestalii]|uniref:Zinc/manganese transport system substrate-binding protein n=1 Tax=Rhodoglobus vestalii TaxID=193384 RepID=A0A8H2K7F0_9MICO|nr:zinc ABC transporter substrate-binding protein [Rhodoglobus vestalii]TQO20074.1 zinc/manganese transport system substrate-binding protein [Rhodoglobus vestalii]